MNPGDRTKSKSKSGDRKKTLKNYGKKVLKTIKKYGKDILKRRTTKKKSKTATTSTTKSTKTSTKSNEPDTYVCPICLENITSDKITTIECDHNFHAKCLQVWCKNKTKVKCPMCRNDISKTCAEIKPFNSQDIFNYTLIGGADTKTKNDSIEIVNKYIDNPQFDINVTNPKNNKSILHELLMYPYDFDDSITKLLQNPDLEIDEKVIPFLVSKNYITDPKIMKLFKNNPHSKKIKKLLKPFM